MSTELLGVVDELHLHVQGLSKEYGQGNVTPFLIGEYNKLLGLARDEEPESVVLRNLGQATLETTYEDLTLMCAQMKTCIYLDPPVTI